MILIAKWVLRFVINNIRLISILHTIADLVYSCFALIQVPDLLSVAGANALRYYFHKCAVADY